MQVACLPGDGIGPEVMSVAFPLLDDLGVRHDEYPFGGAAILEAGVPLPAETLAACRRADAVLLGAVGLPQFDAADIRPEQGLLELRLALDTYANLRPVHNGDIDLIIVRELVGGLYFGPRGVREDGTAFDTSEYNAFQIQRVARMAFNIARSRKRHVTSVDKANVLETSRLWRRVVSEMSGDFTDVALEHALVDSTAMRLVTHPQHFDVILTENLFGDILSDEAAGLTGGLGLAESASLGAGPGIFEPVHGSAPDIAGRGVANPVAMLRSVALMLNLGLGLQVDAKALTAAIDQALETHPTMDLAGHATTAEFGNAVRRYLDAKNRSRRTDA